MATSYIISWEGERIDLTALSDERLERLYDRVINWGSSAVSLYEGGAWRSSKDTFRNRLMECLNAQQCIEAEMQRRDAAVLVA